MADVSTGRVVYHCGGREPVEVIETGLRVLSNAVLGLPAGTRICLLVQGPAVVYLVKGEKPAQRLVALLREAGSDVQILACQISLRTAGVRTEELTDEIGVVPSAVVHLAQLQWQGWAYVRL